MNSSPPALEAPVYRYAEPQPAHSEKALPVGAACLVIGSLSCGLWAVIGKLVMRWVF